MLVLASSLAQIAIEQITVLGRFGVHICLEENVNRVYMS